MDGDVALSDFAQTFAAHRAELKPLLPTRQAYSLTQLGERVSLQVYRDLVRAVPSVAERATFGTIKRKYTAPAQTQLTPAFLRLLGYYLAEGHAEDGYVVLSSGDAAIVTDMSAAVAQLGAGWRHRPGTYDYQVTSRFWASQLKRWCGGDSRSKRLPPFWPSLSNNALAQLLRAYFTADGGVDGQQVTCVTASEQLASDLAYALLRFGILGRIRVRMKRVPGYVDRRACWQVCISGKEFLEHFRDSIGFALDRKQERLEGILPAAANTNVDLIPFDPSELRRIRQSLGLSQRDLAARCACDRAMLSMIESKQDAFDRIVHIGIVDDRIRTLFDMKRLAGKCGFQVVHRRSWSVEPHAVNP